MTNSDRADRHLLYANVERLMERTADRKKKLIRFTATGEDGESLGLYVFTQDRLHDFLKCGLKGYRKAFGADKCPEFFKNSVEVLER